MTFSFKVVTFSVGLLLGLLVAVGNVGAQTPSTGQNAIPIVAKDNYRLLFDPKGGFKVFRIDAQDGSSHSLLNPNSEFPATIDIYRDNILQPLTLLPPEAPQADDPGYKGPAFVSGDLNIQIWGLDMAAYGTGWSALRYELHNSSSSLLTVSARVIIDTWLNENTQEHFSLQQLGDNKNIGISDETRILPGDLPQIIGSQKPGTKDGFYILLPSRTSGLIIPQRVIAANVRRLQNSTALFDFEEHRAFNLLPFSINDSALGLFYDSVVILPNQTVTIDIIFNGQADIDSSHAVAVQARLSAIKPSTFVARSSDIGLGQKNTANTKKSELVNKLNSLIDRLNAMMKNPHYRQGDLEKLIEAIADTKKNLELGP